MLVLFGAVLEVLAGLLLVDAEIDCSLFVVVLFVEATDDDATVVTPDVED